MGRSISTATATSTSASLAPVNAALYPLSGPFGTGKIEFWYQSGTFTVPTGITTVRARLWGSTTVAGLFGNSSSFGAHCSATGSQSTSGGSGSGGDINRSGGSTGATNSYGGGAGNLFGAGNVTSGQGGGGGAAGANGGHGGKGLIGTAGEGYIHATTAPKGATHASGPAFGTFSIDLLGCGCGGGGSGNGSNTNAGNGYNGGGGGASGGSSFPGGGGSGCGGAGFSIKTVTDLTPGSTVAVTVGSAGSNGAPGLVIIEY